MRHLSQIIITWELLSVFFDCATVLRRVFGFGYNERMSTMGPFPTSSQNP
jgi:hypothetical protein